MSKRFAVVATGVSVSTAILCVGCIFSRDCEVGHYCDGDEVWWGNGADILSGCEEWMDKDCGANGRVCREYDGSASCFLPDVTCEERGICEGNTFYDCNRSVGLAKTREECSETGRVCKTYEDEFGENAGCFYEDVVCDEDETAVSNYWFCVEDVAYHCEVDAKLAYSRTDCAEKEKGCIEYDGNHAACSSPCDVDGELACNESRERTLICSDGYWYPQESCEGGRKCALVEADAGVTPLCLEADCTDTEWQNASYCENDVWVFECGGDRTETVCDEGCETYAEVDGGDRVLCAE